jgi:16S rRNA G966 N2-methylase RsmD
MIGSYGILSEACILLCEHSAKTLLPESAGGLKLKKRYRYGDSSLSLYRKEI